MKKFQKTLALIIAFILMSNLMVVNADNTTSGQQSNPITNPNVINRSGAEPDSLDPQVAASEVAMLHLNGIMEGLMRRTGKNLIPGMAHKYDVSKDGLTYTFYLRDAIWSDGEPVTASDFAYGWKRALDPKGVSDYAFSLYYIKNAEKYNNGQVTEDKLGIKVVNEKTLQVVLENPTQYFVGLTATSVYLPSRKDLVDKYQSEYFSTPEKMVSNGPFTLTAWEHDNYITITKNPNYWNEKNIKIDVINTIMYGSSNQIIEKYLKGDLDLAGVTAENVSKLPLNEIKDYSYGSVWYVQFNNMDKTGVLSNANIRKALALSIDRQAYLKESGQSLAAPALALVAPEVIAGKAKSFREEAGNLLENNDIKTAKAALALGLKQLKLKKLPKLTICTDGSNMSINGAAALKKMWKTNLGIDVIVESLQFKARLEKLYSGNYQMTVSSWSPDYYDALGYLEMFDSSVQSNNFGYKNTDFNNLIKSIKKETDRLKRIDLLKKAEKKIIDEYVVAPLYYRYSKVAIKPYLRNAQMGEIGTNVDLTFAEFIENGKTLATDDSKLTIKVNPYWSVDHANTLGFNDAKLAFIDYIEEAAGVVHSFDSGRESSVESFYDAIVKDLKENNPTATFSEKTLTKVNGFPAAQFKFTTVIDGTSMTYFYTLILIPEKLYTVALWSYTDSFVRRTAEFDKMMDGISIVK